ncbi:Pentatricopeptide repeat-containing protein [Nymphaea thermarum]|nr:Pentatricopeptide repeat-containing protein [Nymphaea thermarum]
MIIHHRVVSHLQRCSSLSELKAVHATVVKGDLCNDGRAATQLLGACSSVGMMDYAVLIFAHIRKPEVYAWNVMIRGFDRCALPGDAVRFYGDMLKSGVRPTSFTFSSNKCFKKAVMEFERMQMAGVDPDEVTLSTVISACAHLGALEIGKKIHFFISQHKQISLDVYIGSALIDMYAKCGSIERALLVFFKLREKNLFCWNSLVEGLAMHGYAVEAIALFRRMEMEKKVIPNGVTFVSVLSACAHAGLVDVGREVFSRMTRIYAIKPEIEHYGCMVDLLSRAGYLEDAMALINDMNMKPNAVIWGALLGGCRTHGNVELGEVAVKNLVILEPLNSGYHVLLANMYAKTNRWTDVAKVRRLMKGKGVQKSPGYSSIMVNGVAHEFLSFDDVHPKCEEIYELLEELGLQLRLAGYVPDLGLT